MDTLKKIYWIRVALGAFAGLICTIVSILAESLTQASLISQMSNTNTLINGITIALLVYFLTFYVLKARYFSQVEKKSKIATMGIFIYFFTWLVVWILSLSIVIGPL